VNIRPIALGVALVGALALTACSATPTPTASPAATVSVDKAAATLLPADVAKAGALTWAVDAAYAPNEYKDADGNPIGWDVELATAISQKLGVKATFIQAGFDNIIPSVVAGKYNVGVSSFTDNAEREKQVDFVDYFSAGSQWAAAAGKTVDPDNACGLKVSAMTGSTQALDELPARSKKCTDAGKPAIEILQFDDNAQAITAATLGKVDAVSADSPVTLYGIEQSKGKLVVAGKTFDSAPYGLVLSKKGGLQKAIQAALVALEADGTYKAILTKWGVQSGAVTSFPINGAAAK
jgi:polar amino acid transport system substrate-binding protein